MNSLGRAGTRCGQATSPERCSEPGGCRPKQMTIALLIPTTDAGIEQESGRFSAAMGLG